MTGIITVLCAERIEILHMVELSGVVEVQKKGFSVCSHSESDTVAQSIPKRLTSASMIHYNATTLVVLFQSQLVLFLRFED